MFPDITICNAYPLNVIDATQYDAYTNKISAAQQNWTCDKVREVLRVNISDDDCDDLWTEIQLPAGYFKNLPLFDDGTGDRSLISHCSFYGWNWGPSDASCTDNIRITWDPDYYKCYTIHVPFDSNQVTVSALSTGSHVAYLDVVHDFLYD